MRCVLNIHVTPLLIFLALSTGVTYFDVRFNPPSPSDAETTLEKVVDGFLKLIISLFISPVISAGVTVMVVIGGFSLYVGLLQFHPDFAFILFLDVAPKTFFITFFISLLASLAILLTRMVNYLYSLATILISWVVIVFVLSSIEDHVLKYILNIEFYLYCFALIIVLVVWWVYVRRRSISTSF